MGTPIYAAYILENIISSQHDVVGVFTKPDRPYGRSKELIPSPVKKIAVNHNIPFLQPDNLKTHQSIKDFLGNVHAEIAIVAAYGLILPTSILSVFPLGCLNIHPSLLPKYRGPSPVSTSILNGDTVTGVTIIKLGEGIDNGPILDQKKVLIEQNEKCDNLTNRLFNISSSMIIEVLTSLEKNRIPEKKQSDKDATYTKKLDRSDGLINWTKSANQISDMLRAYHPWPGTYTILNGKKLKIIDLEISTGQIIQTIVPGEVLVDKEVFVGTGNGTIKLIEVKPEGKKAMSAKGFSNGNINFDKSILKNG